MKQQVTKTISHTLASNKENIFIFAGAWMFIMFIHVSDNLNTEKILCPSHNALLPIGHYVQIVDMWVVSD